MPSRHRQALVSGFVIALSLHLRPVFGTIPAYAGEPTLVRVIHPPPTASDYLTGLAIDDAAQRLYVVDRYGHQIYVFDLEGNKVGGWGGQGSAPGQFDNPGDIVLTSTGEVLVADWMNRRIQVFGLEGQFIRQWGSHGTGPGQFESPVDLAIDQSGFVYVADSNSNRIQKFTLGGSYVTGWGSRGTEHGQFASPTGVSVDPSGAIVVADQFNSRLEYFDANGTWLRSTTTRTAEFEFRPVGVHVDGGGRAYVAGFTSGTACFDSHGQQIAHWQTPFWGIRVTTDLAGFIYVSGWSTGQSDGVHVYALPIAVTPTTWSAIKTLLD